MIRRIFSFFWSLILGMVRAIVFLIFLIVLLLTILVGTKQIDLQKTLDQAGQAFNTNPVVIQALDSVRKAVGPTDSIQSDQEGETIGRWKEARATIYIASQSDSYRQAYLTAIDNWNATGVFELVLVQDPTQAQIIAGDHSDAHSQAAGVAKTQTDTITGYLTEVKVYLNDYYLSNPEYGYSQERITHTAEHELGHALGLEHDDKETSVMESSGSNTGIQKVDVQALQALYSK